MRTAAYARYSSDAQRDASLEDQLRNCRAYCARQGWPAPVEFVDAAISGARLDREGYRALLNRVHGFDVLLVDDLSRFGRDQSEISRTVKRLVFAGVRLIGVSDGVDTARKSHKADVGLRGLMSELYLDDLADKTHRGLTGRALAGASAGGLPYGYRVTTVGERSIDPEQASVVRRIFAEYLAGRSPRDIASALNRDGISAPRARTWHVSAIRGDFRRGLGVLANPVYAGQQVWNRSHWVKHPDTGRRVRQERPQSEWIITEQPALAIIDEATWRAAQARANARRTPQTGPKRGGPGRPPKHLLSGILRCESCGSRMVVVDAYRYGCSASKDRGAAVCRSTLRVPRKAIEAALLEGVKRELLTPEAFERFQRHVAAKLKQAAPDLTAVRRRLSDAERARDNIVAALRAGIITPTTRQAMLEAEADVESASRELAAAIAHQPSQILPRAKERWHAAVARLDDVTQDVPAARGALRTLIGENVVVRNANGAIYCEIAPSEIKVVAGAGSALYLTEPLRIPVPLPADRRS